jgi:ABC-type uncharacterized transport system permease subunit
VRKAVTGLQGPLFSILAALAIGGIIIAASGHSPLAAYYTVLEGSFGNLGNAMQVLAYTTPLLLTGACALVAFEAGAMNIGGEGQLYVGALAATVFGLYSSAPRVVTLPIALAIGALAGAIWAVIPTALVGRTPASIVVATIMMNPIGVDLAEYLVRRYFLAKDSATVETNYIRPGAVLPRFTPGTQLTYGIFVALFAVVALWYMLKHTPLGFSLRAIGKNPLAAERAGIPIFKNTLIAMAISGALAGLGGSVVTLGVLRRYVGEFSPGYGWDGITIAILAGGNAFGVLPFAALFGMFRSASVSMNVGGSIPVDLITVLQGLIVCFAATPALWNVLRSQLGLEREGHGYKLLGILHRRSP